MTPWTKAMGVWMNCFHSYYFFWRFEHSFTGPAVRASLKLLPYISSIDPSNLAFEPMKESSETPELVYWFDVNMDRLDSEISAFWFCMPSASCTLCMTKESQPPRTDHLHRLIDHVATEVACSCLTCSVSGVTTATVPGWVLALPVQRLWFSANGHCGVLLMYRLDCMNLCDAKRGTQTVHISVHDLSVFRNGHFSDISKKVLIEQFWVEYLRKGFSKDFIVSFTIRSAAGGHASIHVRFDHNLIVHTL